MRLRGLPQLLRWDKPVRAWQPRGQEHSGQSATWEGRTSPSPGFGARGWGAGEPGTEGTEHMLGV